MSLLTEKLSASIDSSLEDEEKELFRLSLGMAVSSLIQSDSYLPLPGCLPAIQRISSLLNLMNPLRANVPESGIIYHGQPSFLHEKLLLKLREESAFQYKTSIFNFDQYLGIGGPLAREIGVMLVAELIQKCLRVPIVNHSASYLYYNYPGSRVLPHVDSSKFLINAIVMLSHENPSKSSGSKTVIYPPHGDPLYFDLKPGDILIISAGHLPHARSSVTDGESVCVLSLGFGTVRN